MTQIASILNESDGWDMDAIDMEKLHALQKDSEDAEYLDKEHHGTRLSKVSSPLPLTDCFVAPCVEACPIGQDIPDYIALVGKGR